MSEAIATTDRQVALPTFSFLDSLPLKPMTEKEADQLALAQRVGRLEQIGVVHGRIRRLAKDYIRAFAPEIRSFLKLLDNQGSKEGTVLVDGKPVIINGKVIHGKQEAVKELFHVSYQYVFSLLYPRLHKPKEATTVDSPPLPAGTATMSEVNVSDEPPHYCQDGAEEESEGTDGADEAAAARGGAVDAEVVQPEAAAEDQPPFTPSAPQVTPSAGDGLSGLMGHFKETFAQREGREERLKEFFLMVDDEAFIRDIIHAATGACAVAASLGQKIEEARVPEAEGGGDEGEVRVNEEECSRSQELPSLIRGSLEAGKRDDPDHAAGYGVALDCAEGDAVDYGAFKPAVAVGDGNGNGCEPQQEDVPGCKALFLEQEAHGTDSLEVTETADPGSPPCAMPGKRKRAKHPPVPIVLEDGSCGHVIAGLGKLTKRTRYDVRLETGGRVQVAKKPYGSPANLKGLSLVPKAWLVDGEVSLDQVPAFLRGQAPAQESGSVEY